MKLVEEPEGFLAVGEGPAPRRAADALAQQPLEKLALLQRIQIGKAHRRFSGGSTTLRSTPAWGASRLPRYSWSESGGALMAVVARAEGKDLRAQGSVGHGFRRGGKPDGGHAALPSAPVPQDLPE